MKILLITENLGSGGAERQLSGLAVLMKEKGYEVKVITYLENQFFEPYLKANGIDYEFYPCLLNRFTRVYYLCRILKKYRPDTVISYLSAVNMSVCLARLFYPMRLIVSERSHTLDFGLKTKLLYRLYNIADIVVPNSHSEAENILLYFPFLISKIVTIPNFVDVDTFIPLHSRKENDILKILCVGRVIASKNILRLLDAVRKVLDKGMVFEVIWVGSHYDTSYCEMVREKILELHLEDSFLLKDQVDNVISEYQHADFFCLPSLLEGYPNVLCEAMSCGLPVICSDVYENSYIVQEGINGFLFDPYDIDNIAVAIEKIVSLSVLERIQMGHRNRVHVQNENSKEKFVNRYITLLK